MTNDQYIFSIIQNYYLCPIDINDYRIRPITDYLISWAGHHLSTLKMSGSTAKNTLIAGNTDLDIFISLKSSLNMNLHDIYYDLHDCLDEHLDVRKQNVSIGGEWNGLSIDFIPAKRHHSNSNYHSLYVRKKDTWTQTNIDLHINSVLKSNRLNEIRATKIWRELHEISFPSFYLELIVMEACKYRYYNDLSNNFCSVLVYLRDSFVAKRIVDPANSNNVISDLLSQSEKEEIADQAEESLNEYWTEIIW